VAELDEARNTAGVIDGVSLVDWLREELSLSADCRQRVAELEAAQDNQADSLRRWSDLWTHINNRLGYADGDLLPNKSNFDYLIRDNWLIQSTEPTIITPNNCRHCQRAAEKMRDRAAVCVAGMWRLKDQFGEYHMINLQPVSDTIMTLPLKSCDGCNPLKPE
jgi:hypothetical protein